MSTDQFPYYPPVLRLWEIRNPGTPYLNSYWESYLKKDPEMLGVAICIEIFFSSDKKMYLSTDPINSKSTLDGNEYFYIPALSYSSTLRSTAKMGSAKATSRTITLKIPNQIVDAAEFIKQGRFLAGMAEVSLQFNGMDYAERFILLKGTVDDGVKFDVTDGGLVEFTISDPFDSLDKNIPQDIITSNSFNHVPDSSIGMRIPIVLNGYPYVPGFYVDWDGKYYSATKAKVMGALGHNLTINTVYRDGDVADPASIVYGWTFLQESTSGVGFSGINCINPGATSGDEAFYFDMSVNIPYGSNIRSDSYTFDPKTVVDMIKHICFHYTSFSVAGIDELAFSRASAKYCNYESKVCINASGSGSTTALGFIQGGLLNDYPMICMAYTGAGYGPVCIDRRSKLFIANYTVGQYPFIERASMVVESAKSQVYNSFIVQYDFNAMDNTYGGIVTRNPNNNDLCNLSRDMCGERPHPVMQCSTVFSESLAIYIADWLVTHLSLPHYYVEYDVYSSALFDLFLGDNILLTDSDFGWEDIPATVCMVEHKRGHATIGLYLWYFYYKIDGASSDGTITTQSPLPDG